MIENVCHRFGLRAPECPNSTMPCFAGFPNPVLGVFVQGLQVCSDDAEHRELGVIGAVLQAHREAGHPVPAVLVLDIHSRTAVNSSATVSSHPRLRSTYPAGQPRDTAADGQSI